MTRRWRLYNLGLAAGFLGGGILMVSGQLAALGLPVAVILLGAFVFTMNRAHRL